MNRNEIINQLGDWLRENLWGKGSYELAEEALRFLEIKGISFAQHEKTANFIDSLIDSEAAPIEMSEEELAKLFDEKHEKQKEAPKTLDKMSLEEIKSWEKAQDNSNDIYKIKARVANLARGPGVSLTPQGEMLCNTYVHVMKAFYDFAEKIEDKDIKIQLTQLIRSQEGMPGTLIAAAGAGVRMKKDEENKPV